MKKLISLILALAVVLALAACTPDTPADSSSETAPTSSADETVSYEKPEKLIREGNGASEFANTVASFDVTPAELIAKQTSLDSYDCECFWLNEKDIVAFYSYSVETMPNYYEKRVDVCVYGGDNGDFSGVTENYKTLSGAFPTYTVGNNAFAVCFSGKKIEVYDRDIDVINSYTGSDMLLFSMGDSFSDVLYSDGDKLFLGENAVDAGLSEYTSGAVSEDGARIAATDGATGVYIVNGKKYQADVSGVANLVTAYVTGEAAYFVGKVQAGNDDLRAIRIKNDGTTDEIKFGEELKNTYCRGKIIENNGTLYLITALTPGFNDFGNAEIKTLDIDLKPTVLMTIDGGWRSYHNYDFDENGRLLLTENVEDLTDIKDYMHIINIK